MGERSRTDPGTLEDAGAETPGSVTESRTAESSDADDSAPRDGVSLTGPGIDQKTEREVRRRTATLQKAFLRTVEEAWHLGKALRTAKEQVRHGQWIPWLNEVGLATRTRAALHVAPRAGSRNAPRGAFRKHHSGGTRTAGGQGVADERWVDILGRSWTRSAGGERDSR